MLLLNNVTKKYGTFTALADINLEFTGGVYALLAPNSERRGAKRFLTHALTIYSESVSMLEIIIRGAMWFLKRVKRSN